MAGKAAQTSNEMPAKDQLSAAGILDRLGDGRIVVGIHRRAVDDIHPRPAAERVRETALLEHFTRFWTTTAGEPRAVHDAFISASPLVEGISLDAAVALASVRSGPRCPGGDVQT